jgi:hypothetical protein
MAAQFPGIKPTDRSFRLGQYPTKVYRALSGATVKRSYGNRPYAYEIKLSFTNIPDTTTTQLLTHYTSTRGGFERFTLPAELFAGMSAALTSQIQAPTQILWEYTSPPEVTSVYTDRSTVAITLAGELEYP